jgi:hypothetical protein
MRRIGVLVIALSLVVLCADTASAQKQKQKGRQGGFGGGGAPTAAVLLANEGVQKELKLDEDQIKKVGALARETFTKYGEKFREAAGDMEKMAALRKEIETEQNKTISETLKSGQVKRLKQIELQVGGLRALGKEDIQKELKLSDKQKEEIKSLTEEVGKDVRSIMQDVGRDPEKRAEAMKKVEALNKKALEKFTGTLSADQKKTLKDMEGEKFDYKPAQRRRPNTDA